MITAVSTGWVYGLEPLQQLSLSHNNLTRIDGNSWSFCPNLRDLDLAWNDLHRLEKGSFSGLPGLQLLGLAHNSIVHITSGAFHGLDALQSLDMSRNQLHSADTLAVRHLRSLKEVRLAHNKLTEIPNFGEAAPNITLLSLHRNHIRTLHAEHLARCSSLLTLDLSANHLTGKGLYTLSSSIPLHTLVLSGNRIRVLHAGSLDSLSSSLRVLHLARNRLTSLPKNAFNLGQLQELDLSHNRLRWVEGLTFHLGVLETLHLQHNLITDLMDGSFWGLHAIRSLNLQHNSIPAVSTGWVYGLRSLRQLYLSRNNITRIDANAWSFCPHLFELDLAWNGLDHLDKESFSGLPALRRLSLEHNSIGHVAEGAFHGLDALRSLNISHNEISWSVEDTNGAFSGFGRLTTLGLQGNKIKLITKNTFSQLESLEELDLEDNPIISIQADALMSLKALKHLRLNSSNLLCDCQLQWLTPWLAQQGVGQSVHIICGHPTWLRGHPVYMVSPEHFVCENLTKPRIIVQPETQSALRGSDVSFMCSALTPLDSTLTFLWRKDNLPLSSSEGEVHTQEGKHPEAGASHDEVTSELRLPAVDFTHEGRYQCLASNALGTAYSDKARLTVSVFPSFTKTPTDQSLRVGMTARLECAAAGHPAPQVAWQKDGGTDFPAARERRMHVMPTDDVFFIVGLKPADAGVYTCTAQNAAGSITANATLAVLETPWFVRPLRDRTVVVGETAVLHCIAAGSPPPRLTWSRRNEPLTLTERHFFAADNQLLVIVNASPEDSGSYTCELSNTLGTERGRLHLSVVRSPDCQVPPEPQVAGVATSSSDQATTVGVVVIVVVCCVVGTSVVWVIIIYHTRRRGEAYSVSNTDDTLVPPDVPSYLSSQGTLAERPEGSGRSESGSSNQLTSSPGVHPPVLEDPDMISSPGVGVPPEVAPLCAECCQRSVGGGESMTDEVSSKISSVVGSSPEFAMTTHAGHVATPYPSNHDRPNGGEEHSLLVGLQSQSQV
uniref:leucine-rich repeats and immunoglobulin-like domains protein 3 isoform X1 n=1 Tax=Myxine glutinosa TaxID=7769 RepID=UPI00358DF993